MRCPVITSHSGPAARMFAYWLLSLPICTVAHAQLSPTLGQPPRAALIRVSAPEITGDVMVTAQAGAVQGQSLVGLLTLDTGHFTVTRAAADGSFAARLYAPAESTIQVKADTSSLLERFLTT